MDGIELFRREATQISEFYPDLSYIELPDDIPAVEGLIQLTDQKGIIQDAYQVRILPSSKYPFRFPIVFERGGRLPVNLEWHIYPSDGSCCIKCYPEELLICKPGITLTWFIKEQVKPYFYSQKFREIHGYYLRERSHGREGHVEFFEDLLRTSDKKFIAQTLYLVRQRTEPNRVAECFCGSGMKYRNCHRDAYRIIDKYSDKELMEFMRLILEN